MSPADRLIALLKNTTEQRRPRYARAWKACCPAHDDKTPSLCIDEKHDGTVLLKCWAGCDSARIMDAVGMGFAELHPGDAPLPRRERKYDPTEDLLVLSIAQGMRKREGRLTRADKRREKLAYSRLKGAGMA